MSSIYYNVPYNLQKCLTFFNLTTQFISLMALHKYAFVGSRLCQRCAVVGAMSESARTAVYSDSEPFSSLEYGFGLSRSNCPSNSPALRSAPVREGRLLLSKMTVSTMRILQCALLSDSPKQYPDTVGRTVPVTVQLQYSDSPATVLRQSRYSRQHSTMTV